MNDDWALCVGIGSYEDGSSLASLPGALNDARTMHEWLIRPDGGDVPVSQADLILSPAIQPLGGEAKPTDGQIESFFVKLYKLGLASRQQHDGFRVGRRLWLFFAGHGVSFPGDGETGLLTAKAFPPDILPHVVGHGWAEVFRASRAFREVVLFMDCCRTHANHTAARKPYVRMGQDGAGGKMVGAFAVSNSKAAFEVEVGGTPRGRFSYALQGLLLKPPARPFSTRDFLDHLERAYPDVDPIRPKKLADDFDILGAAPVTPASSMLIAHGETTKALARSIARAMRTPTRIPLVRWAGSVTADDSVGFEGIDELLVTREVDEEQLRDLIETVEPRRTVVFGEVDPGVANVPNATFVHQAGGDDPDLDESVAALDAAFADARGRLIVRASEAVARVRVWSPEGRLVASGYESVALEDVPAGTYLARAALGGQHVQRATEVVADVQHEIQLPALTIALPSSDERAAVVLSNVDDARRALGTVDLSEGDTVVLSLPRVAGWRTEVFVPPSGGFVPLSVRMVPTDHPEGAPSPTDALRESLHWALASPGWGAQGVDASRLVDDPIGALLCAALRARNGVAFEAHLKVAAAVLGEDDVDIRLLRGDLWELTLPPLLAVPWHLALRRNELSVASGSVADRVVGRMRVTRPWFSWSSREKVATSEWLSQVANTAWPGWEQAPDVDLAYAGFADASQSLGAPEPSIRRLNYKAPPIDSLEEHQRIAFVGASNDQLPAAMAVAFAGRGKKRWERIDVWSLNDVPLAEMISANRTGEQLVRARDAAEAQLSRLLEIVAESSSMHRYDGLMIEGQRTFASLWDWTVEGKGYVHASPWEEDKDIRIAQQQNPRWTATTPPPRYVEVVKAYEAMAVSPYE